MLDARITDEDADRAEFALRIGDERADLSRL
jgi:hypothetical protein